MQMLHLRPAAPGLVIPKPEGGRLAAEGEDVPNTEFWRRRILDGDVVEMREPSPPETIARKAQK